MLLLLYINTVVGRTNDSNTTLPDTEYIGSTSRAPARTSIVIHFNSKSISFSLSVNSPAAAIEGAIRVVCGIDARTPFYLKNDRGEICVVDGTIPTGDYTLIATSDCSIAKQPLFGGMHYSTTASCLALTYPLLSTQYREVTRMHHFQLLLHLTWYDTNNPTHYNLCLQNCHLSCINTYSHSYHLWISSTQERYPLFNAPEFNQLKVCKAWHMISNDPELWKKLYIWRFDDSENKEHMLKEIEDPQLPKMGWKNVYMVWYVGGVCSILLMPFSATSLTCVHMT